MVTIGYFQKNLVDTLGSNWSWYSNHCCIIPKQNISQTFGYPCLDKKKQGHINTEQKNNVWFTSFMNANYIVSMAWNLFFCSIENQVLHCVNLWMENQNVTFKLLCPIVFMRSKHKHRCVYLSKRNITSTASIFSGILDTVVTVHWAVFIIDWTVKPLHCVPKSVEVQWALDLVTLLLSKNLSLNCTLSLHIFTDFK